MKKPKIKIALPSLIMGGALIFSGKLTVLTAIVLAAVLHELGHIAAACILKIDFEEFSLSLLGARLKMGSRLISYRDEILLAASGPFINIISFIAFYPQTSWAGWLGEFFAYFTAASLFLGCLNLLPISTFDGGRILYTSVAAKASPALASNILRGLSFVCLFGLWCISSYLLIKTGNSLSLFVFSITLFARIFIPE